MSKMNIISDKLCVPELVSAVIPVVEAWWVTAAVEKLLAVPALVDGLVIVGPAEVVVLAVLELDAVAVELLNRTFWMHMLSHVED